MDSVSHGSAVARGGGHQESGLHPTITGGRGGLHSIIPNSTITGGGSSAGKVGITGGNGGMPVTSTQQITAAK